MSTPKKFTKSTSNPNENTKKPPPTKGQEPTNAKDSGPSMFPSTPFQKFLISHMHKKTEPSDTITNTRISGGSYTIPETEYANFLNLYYHHVFVENNHEYLTERQYKDKGPIAIDFDFQFAKDVKKRQYTDDHITEILNAYLEVLATVYQLVNPNDDCDDDDDEEDSDGDDEREDDCEKSQVSSLSEDEEATAVLGMQKPDSGKRKQKPKHNLPTVFEIYVFEKPNVNTMFSESKGIVKDGLHFIFGINSDALTKEIIRERIMPKLQPILGDIGLTNSMDSVVDAGVAKCTTAWTLTGSRKPQHEAYELTQWYEVGISKERACFVLKDKKQASDMVFPRDLGKLSVRNCQHPELYFRTDFANLRMEMISKKEEAKLMAETQDQNTGINGMANFIQAQGAANGLRGLGLIPGNKGLMTVGIPEQNILAVRNMEQLEALTFQFLDNLRLAQTPEAYELLEAHDYTMSLPATYYETGSHNNRIKVCWALHNISPALLIVWIRFFYQRSVKDFSRIQELVDDWNKTDTNRTIPLSKGSIRHWAKHENQTGYENVRRNTIDFMIDQTIKTLTLSSLDTSSNNDSDKRTGDDDYGKAMVLYTMFKDEYVCVSPKNQIWYQFYGNRWHEIEGGTSLRLAISQDLRPMYINKAKRFKEQLSRIDPDHADYKMKKKLVEMVLEMAAKMGQTSHKKHIMIEAADLFYVRDFMEKLDTKPYLMCCNNGVMDFSENRFRRGYPEDYISKCTGLDYIALSPPPPRAVSSNAQHNQTNSVNRNQKPIPENKLAIMEEIREFMRQLFPQPELCAYMWEHLASIMIGDIVLTQSLHIYLGKGRNGKSTLVDGLMAAILGSYKVVLPVSFYTTERSKQGSASPEIVKLMGARLACSPEPSKGEHLIEGPMKQLTSGIDMMSGRALFKDLVEFRPQCHPVICANNLPSVQATDEGTWRRIKIVEFLSYFTEKPEHGNPFRPHQFLLVANFDKKIEEWKEIFLAMLIEIAMETGGKVRSCEMVERASNEYRAKQDVISEFITELVVPDIRSKVTKAEVQQHFNTWYRSAYGMTNLPPITDVHESLDRHFGNYNRAQKGWLGVKLVPDKMLSSSGVADVFEPQDQDKQDQEPQEEEDKVSEPISQTHQKAEVEEPVVIVKKKMIKKKV